MIITKYLGAILDSSCFFKEEKDGIFLFCAIYVYPLVEIFVTSFTKWNYKNILKPEFLGWDHIFDNYIKLFTVDKNFQQALINSIKWVILTMAVQIPFTISISLPIYQLLGDLGLKDTHAGAIFVYSGLGIAVTYFILRSLGQFTTAYSKSLNGMFSATIVTVIPTIVVFCLLSETFVKSLTAGAVKG